MGRKPSGNICIKCKKGSLGEICGRCRMREKRRQEESSPFLEAGIRNYVAGRRMK